MENCYYHIMSRVITFAVIFSKSAINMGAVQMSYLPNQRNKNRGKKLGWVGFFKEVSFQLLPE